MFRINALSLTALALLTSLLASCSQSSHSKPAPDQDVNATESKRTSSQTDEIGEKVKRIIAEQMGVATADFSLDDSLTTKLGADELDIVELVMTVEEEFNLTIPDSEIVATNSNSVSVNFCGADFVRLVKARLENQSP